MFNPTKETEFVPANLIWYLTNPSSGEIGAHNVPRTLFHVGLHHPQGWGELVLKFVNQTPARPCFDLTIAFR